MPFAATSVDLEIVTLADSLSGQCLGLLSFTTEDMGSIPGQRINIPEAVQCSQSEEKRQKERGKTTQNNIQGQGTLTHPPPWGLPKHQAPRATLAATESSGHSDGDSLYHIQRQVLNRDAI